MYVIDAPKTFQALMLVGLQRKANRETGELQTTKDGTPKWAVQVAAIPHDGNGRPEMLTVGIASDRDLSESAVWGPVALPGLRLGMFQNGGGPVVYWQADDVRPVK